MSGIKHLIKSIGSGLGYWMLARAVGSLDTGDLSLHYRRAELLGRIAYTFARSRRNVMLSNLRLAFPEWSGARVRRTARQVVRNLGRGFVDLFNWVHLKERYQERVRVVNGHFLDEAVASGRGFLLATGHVDIFMFVGMPLTWRGVPYGVIARKVSDERIDALYEWGKSSVGLVSIPDDPPMAILKGIRQVSKQGGGILYTFDMHPAHRGGVDVEFMGRRTPMFSGMVRIAARMRLPILPCFTVREPDGRGHRITYYPLMEIPREAAEENSPVAVDLVSTLADWLTGVVRAYPSQWWWIHRRWRPGD